MSPPPPGRRESISGPTSFSSVQFWFRDGKTVDARGRWPCSGSTSLSADTCFHTCDLLAQMSVGAALCCTSTR